jgi:quinol monooxygenase YgiN
MIVIYVQVQVKADHAPDFAAAAKQDVAGGQQFAGCRAYHWSEHLTSPYSYILYEEWETREAFDAFRTSEYFKNTGTVLMPMLDGAPSSAYYTAALMEG